MTVLPNSGMVIANHDLASKSCDHTVKRLYGNTALRYGYARTRQAEACRFLGRCERPREVCNRRLRCNHIKFYCCNCAMITNEFDEPQTDPAARLKLKRVFHKGALFRSKLTALRRRCCFGHAYIAGEVFKASEKRRSCWLLAVILSIFI